MKVLNIDACNDEIQIQLTTSFSTSGDDVTQFTMTIGKRIWVIDDVRLNFITINTVGITYAMLGFEAPRDIKICGSWQSGNKKHAKLGRKALSQMNASTLVYYASNNVKSALEHELLARLKSLM